MGKEAGNLNYASCFNVSMINRTLSLNYPDYPNHPSPELFEHLFNAEPPVDGRQRSQWSAFIGQ